MAELLILWGYLFVINACIGAGTLRAIRCLALGKQRSGDNVTALGAEMALESGFVPWTQLFGIIAITVYAQIFSLFGAVGAAAHVLLLVLTVLCAFFLQARAMPDGKKNSEDPFLMGWRIVPDSDPSDCAVCFPRSSAHGYRNLSCPDDPLV